MRNILQNVLNWVARNFSEDASKMLIWTGVIGWGLSSLAQICAILFNPKIPKEQKGYLLPQEIGDAAVNIGSFFLITQMAKGLTSRLFKSGKLGSKSVKEFINNNKSIIGDKLGKLDYDLGKAFKDNPSFPMRDYTILKDFGTIVATITGGVISTNIVTPLVRNSMATKMQKSYLKNLQADSYDQPTFKSLPKNQVYNLSMRI